MNKLKKIAAVITAIVVVGGVVQIPISPNTEFQTYAAEIAYYQYGDWWYSVLSDGNVVITQYDGDDEIVTIPSQINGRTVVEIGDYALLASTYPPDITKEVILPNTIKKISGGAFMNCPKLEKVNIPDSVKEIGVRAFNGCTSLKSINLNKVEKLGFGVFEDCSNLEQLYIPGNIKTIPERAFHNCTNLKSLTIGEGVTTIERKAALNTTSLQSIKFPDSVTSIGEYAFGYSMEQTTEYTKYILSVDNIKEYSCGSDSAAEKYGIDNGIIEVFEGSFSDENIITPIVPSIPDFSSLNGDIDLNNSVDASDASAVLAEYSAIQTGGNSTFSRIQKSLADVNNDGVVDSSDASKILAYYSAVSTGKTPSWT